MNIFIEILQFEIFIFDLNLKSWASPVSYPSETVELFFEQIDLDGSIGWLHIDFSN
jgi:hypothetical protein